jgi:hypothetical protein
MHYPMLGLKSFRSAAVTSSGVELAQKIMKRQYDTSAVIVRKGRRMSHVWQPVLAA